MNMVHEVGDHLNGRLGLCVAVGTGQSPCVRACSAAALAERRPCL